MNLFTSFIFVFYYVEFVLGVGLNEEFTWTRITYQWPQENQLSSRFAYERYRGGKVRNRPQRPSYGGSGGAPIVFEGSTNAESVVANTKPSNKPNPKGGPGSIDYQYERNIPMGANVWKNKLFITVPRRRLGVPSALNYVPLDSATKHNVPLIPYPDWDSNLFPDTSGRGDNFVSVYRVAIDECDRMWFVDTGIVETIGNWTKIKPQQLVIINLQNDQVIHRFDFPEEVLTPATALASLKVEGIKGSCGDAYAYIPDLAGFGLVVYSLKDNRAWRVRHNYFYVEPLAGDFFIAGHQFQWNDGVFSVELSDVKPDGYRDLYFHAMSGTHMYKVSTRTLKNETLATRSFHGDDFELIGDKGPNSHTSMADIHISTSTMFLGLVNQNAVGCWNINKDLSTTSVVHKDDDKMIYPSDLKVSGDKVFVLTNTMPGFLYGRLDYDTVNFRVWSNDVRKAIQGTQCQTN